jgi:heme A synthase
VEPELGRDATVAVVLIAAIVTLASSTIMLGLAVLVAAALLGGVTIMVRALNRSTRPRRRAARSRILP